MTPSDLYDNLGLQIGGGSIVSFGGYTRSLIMTLSIVLLALPPNYENEIKRYIMTTQNSGERKIIWQIFLMTQDLPV